MLRLLIIPVFLLMIIYNDLHARIFFCILFIIASITDFFDGYLARRLNAHTTFGKIFDPIADKALVIILSVIILLVHKDLTFYIVLPIVLLILRELIISGLREGLATSEIQTVINVSKLSKYKTFFQLTSLCLLILGGNENIVLLILQIIGVILLYCSLCLSLLSAYHYIVNSISKRFFN